MLPPLTVIFMWPLAVMLFFKRFSLAGAISVSIVAGYLLLPVKVGFNLPMLPTLNKDSVPSFAVLCLLLLFYRSPAVGSLPGWLPRTRVGVLLLGASFLGGVMTVMTNGDRLVFTNHSITGLSTYDIFSATLGLMVTLLPFLIARKYLASAQSHKTLLVVLSTAGLLYSVLALYEIRFSPQLNNMVYGFYPPGWIQNLRDGGFRPFVFVSHGLRLGIFLSCAVLATLALARWGDASRRVYFWIAFFWMFVILVLTKAFGALLIALVLIPVVMFLSTRMQMIVAAAIAGTILLYPMLRGADLVPADRIISVVRSIADERASSLQYRINNEDILLEKAAQRPVFGWGGWGRARVYNENGRDISTTDGVWVITIGEVGWVGYLGQFGLLCGPIILLAWRNRDKVGPETAALAIVLVANLVDMIPNSGLTVITWLIAGALMGRYEMQKADVPESTGPPPEPETRKLRYSRRPPRAGSRARQSYTRDESSPLPSRTSKQ